MQNTYITALETKIIILIETKQAEIKTEILKKEKLKLTLAE